MKKPYKMALRIPSFLFFALFVKNETVKGIIGNTQGVKSAISPPIKPKKKIGKKLFDS